MIFDTVKHLENYKNFPLLYEALSYINTLSPQDFPAKGEVFKDNVLFFNPVTLTTRPESECKYEAHQKFIDLHYTVSGTERIKVADVAALNTLEEYDAVRDIGFYEGAESSCVDVTPGYFLLCFPKDAHKVAMMKDEPAHVKKLVFKISYDAFLNE